LAVEAETASLEIDSRKNEKETLNTARARSAGAKG
jgi:hypothetical protein